MTKITANLPSQFHIQPTIPFIFNDTHTNKFKHLSMVGNYHYNVIEQDGEYLIVFIATKPKHETIKGFISKEDLVDGIVKGKLVIVE